MDKIVEAGQPRLARHLSLSTSPWREMCGVGEGSGGKSAGVGWQALLAASAADVVAARREAEGFKVACAQ